MGRPPVARQPPAVAGAERVAVPGRRRAGHCVQGGLFHPLPAHGCVTAEPLSGSPLNNFSCSQSPSEPASPLRRSSPPQAFSLLTTPLCQGNPLPRLALRPLLFLQHSGGGCCTWSLLWRIEYHERVRSQGQQLQQLQAELEKLHKEVSSVRAANSERVAKIVFQRLNEDFVRKPDYALSSVGASIDLEKTSHDYEDANTAYFWNRFSFWNYARPPTVILEPDVFPGNCWAFEGDQGQVVIRLPGRVQLSDITLQHPPPSVAHTGGANSAPRDFAVYGLQLDDETEVFLGKFTFDVEKSEIQTFHLQNDPPTAFPKVKIQILSNWGHPRFTCLYRVRAHGMRTSEGAGDSATGEPH
uniref:sperm-associated antigen 4 protein isoform X4 n=1 Tax=Halichoerus grypus TaxID=9711 RepID=UPI001659BBAB|nr:sperm-associated antigen 4 protein isoform X4 [Halichoerus grypus]